MMSAQVRPEESALFRISEVCAIDQDYVPGFVEVRTVCLEGSQKLLASSWIFRGVSLLELVITSPLNKLFAVSVGIVWVLENNQSTGDNDSFS